MSDAIRRLHDMRGAAGTGAAAPEHAHRGAPQDAASHARGVQAGGALPRSGARGASPMRAETKEAAVRQR